jgi:hypothetical protein
MPSPNVSPPLDLGLAPIPKPEDFPPALCFLAQRRRGAEEEKAAEQTQKACPPVGILRPTDRHGHDGQGDRGTGFWSCPALLRCGNSARRFVIHPNAKGPRPRSVLNWAMGPVFRARVNEANPNPNPNHPP